GVGTDPTRDPVVIGLVGITAVLRHASAFIELAEGCDGGLAGRPGLPEKSGLVPAGKDVVAVDHQHELGVEIFPVVRVLPAWFIDSYKWIAFRHSQIMGHSADLFALVRDRLSCLRGLP